MMISAKNKTLVSHKKTLSEYSINTLGFKLCHIEEIGLNTRTPIEEIGITALEAHFIKMNNPKNMFLVPLELSGLGEVPDFIQMQK